MKGNTCLSKHKQADSPSKCPGGKEICFAKSQIRFERSSARRRKVNLLCCFELLLTI